MDDQHKRQSFLRNSITLKVIILGVLILALLIPKFMIQKLIMERQQLRQQVIEEINFKWGNSQVITGPIISIPYKRYEKVDKEIVEYYEYAYFLPEELNVTGEILPQIRYRGIYKVVVYETLLNVSGTFQRPDFSGLNVDSNHILWDKASIIIGIPDLRGINQNIYVKWNNHEVPVEPGVRGGDFIYSGLTASIPLTEDTLNHFSFSLDLNGSDELHFTPLGKETNVSVQSKWSDPSFNGAFLPDSREINENGFKANWKVLHLNRNYPQKWVGSNFSVDASSFGVNLHAGVDEYQKNMRSVKYAIMFISLTFMVFFFAEILNKKRVHPIQYLLIGFGLTLFYTLLLSLSEHISFTIAYIVASVAIIVLITIYTNGIFKNFKITMIVGSVLVALYIFLFTILRLQDFSLLMGSIGLFIALAIVMYLSRRVNWYSSLDEK